MCNILPVFFKEGLVAQRSDNPNLQWSYSSAPFLNDVILDSLLWPLIKFLCQGVIRSPKLYPWSYTTFSSLPQTCSYLTKSAHQQGLFSDLEESFSARSISKASLSPKSPVHTLQKFWGNQILNINRLLMTVINILTITTKTQ